MKVPSFILAFALALALAAPARAEVQPFEPGSLAKIRAARAGRPFILAFWSLDCAHCPKELQALGEFRQRHPGVDVVLVSTDTPDSAPLLAGFAAKQGLAAADQWVFADPQPQKLRFEVDRRWWGELPRTYLYDGDHKIVAVSGLVAPEVLQQWLARNAAQRLVQQP